MSLFTTNLGNNNPAISNNIRNPSITSSPNVSDKFTSQSNYGLNNKSFSMPVNGPNSYARNKNDIRVGGFQPNAKIPSESYTPSNIAKTFSNIEQQASAALLSAGVFTSVMSFSNPIGVAIGVGASVLGASGEVINPLIAPAVDKFINVFSGT